MTTLPQETADTILPATNTQQQAPRPTPHLAGTDPDGATTTGMNGRERVVPARGEVVVEHWSANFSINKTAANPAPNPAPVPPVAADDPAGGQTLIAIQRIPENQEMVASPPAGARTAQVDPAGQRQDINSSYIHANLPNQATQGDTEPNNDHQPGNDKGRNGSDLRSSGEQIRQQPTSLHAGDQPLVFSLDQAGGASAATGQQQAPLSTSMHQAPGLPVNEAHVMDQVIHHFGGSRHLESGTVVLRLHPQELGELRMEIKVEQDNIKAHITTNNPQVQDILDRHLPRLREALEQQGMNLEQMRISVAQGDTSNTQLFQEHRGHQQAQRPVRGPGPRQAAFTIPEDEPEFGLAGDDRNLSILA